ncbi:TonB-dependent receptor [Tenuifilum thalassicum]|uniref:TonB-dependent receptor n=1 Tax=Tenuifilum thalassicum TaxID=2590900 RepID=A0A7D4BKT2_9BACT|nr:TonB-dependent receptor [Tenuifilum thalassicum]QKG80439.1 TonB-dependent receptor [Tenuifilum thalassicum]
MNRKILILLIAILSIPASIAAQDKGLVKGRVFDSKTNEPIPFATVVVFGTTIGTTSDFDGNFVIAGLEPGWVELQVSFIGYKPYVTPAVMVTRSKNVFLEIPLEEVALDIEGVVVTASAFRRSEEAPLSLRRIGIAEIERNPGGNRDISRVIQSLPGVAPSLAYRNDVIVRGGGPNENRFYLDGVEIPNLNHFATQGASGGPVGIINVDFVREVNFYSGAFPSSAGNALSSILDFRLIDGNSERLKVKAAVGASDLALTLDGPLTKNTTMIFSARRSYLQFLFSALGLPFLPTYNDFQFKTKTRIDSKNEITVLGLGAIDDFELNLGLKNPDEYQSYILGYLPVNTQWNYTLGVVYKHYADNGYHTFVVSRNMLNNRQYKFTNNDENLPKLLDYTSWEAENKLRYEHDFKWNDFNVNYGAGLEYARYFNSTFRAKFVGDTYLPDTYETNMDLFKWSMFGQLNRTFLKYLTLSFGIRADANSYSNTISNLLDQISPRFSASYALKPNFFLNANVGRYFQLPPYTALGFADTNGNLVNKENGITYIKSDHLMAGFEWQPNETSQLTVEGFLKFYDKYPVSINDSVSISSKSADYGTFGDEPLVSTGQGRSYGLELLYRNKKLLGFNALFSYTLVRSETSLMDNNLQPTDSWIPTSWDNRHLVTITATRSFKKGWDFGFKWRLVGGPPYTPYDLATSSLINVWDVQRQPLFDYSRFNSKRLSAFHQLDVRIDKSYFFDKWMLNIYVDVQNVYNFQGDRPPLYTTAADANGAALVDPNDPTRYQLKRIEGSGGGTVLPTIGVIVEF